MDLQSIPSVCGQFQLTSVRAGQTVSLARIHVMPQRFSRPDDDERRLSVDLRRFAGDQR